MEGGREGGRASFGSVFHYNTVVAFGTVMGQVNTIGRERTLPVEAPPAAVRKRTIFSWGPLPSSAALSPQVEPDEREIYQRREVAVAKGSVCSRIV